MLGRQGDNGSGTGNRNEHHDECNQKKQRRNVTAKSLACTHRLLYHAQAGIPERGLLLPTQQEKVRGNEHRHNQEKPEHLRP